MSLFNSLDRTKFLDEFNSPVHTKAGIVSAASAKAKARTNLGVAAAADIPGDATTATAGVVKQAANQAASTASDVATIKTDFNTLLAALKTAGIVAPDA
jgi:hypothetical protein